jgi:hypothetical protein
MPSKQFVLIFMPCIDAIACTQFSPLCILTHGYIRHHGSQDRQGAVQTIMPNLLNQKHELNNKGNQFSLIQRHTSSRDKDWGSLKIGVDLSSSSNDCSWSHEYHTLYMGASREVTIKI